VADCCRCIRASRVESKSCWIEHYKFDSAPDSLDSRLLVDWLNQIQVYTLLLFQIAWCWKLSLFTEKVGLQTTLLVGAVMIRRVFLLIFSSEMGISRSHFLPFIAWSSVVVLVLCMKILPPCTETGLQLPFSMLVITLEFYIATLYVSGRWKGCFSVIFRVMIQSWGNSKYCFC
jgi:hypothetical protein